MALARYLPNLDSSRRGRRQVPPRHEEPINLKRSSGDPRPRDGIPTFLVQPEKCIELFNQRRRPTDPRNADMRSVAQRQMSVTGRPRVAISATTDSTHKERCRPLGSVGKRRHEKRRWTRPLGRLELPAGILPRSDHWRFWPSTRSIGLSSAGPRTRRADCACSASSCMRAPKASACRMRPSTGTTQANLPTR